MFAKLKAFLIRMMSGDVVRPDGEKEKVDMVERYTREVKKLTEMTRNGEDTKAQEELVERLKKEMNEELESSLDKFTREVDELEKKLFGKK